MKTVPFDPEDGKLVKTIMDVPALKPLVGDKLSDFMKMVTITDYEPLENVITQGEQDQRMFFLLNGKLSVRVDDVEICVIGTPNTVFGEMGIIDTAPRSATVMAKRASRCLALDIGCFDKLQGRAKLAIQAFFYKMFYDILVIRLRETNAHLADLDMQRVVIENMDI